jgi:hypothetical protein
MGVSFLWLSLCIPPKHVPAAAARFSEAVTASPVRATARRVLARWRKTPSSLCPELVPDPDDADAWKRTKDSETFDEIFRPAGMRALGEGLFMTGAEYKEWGIEPTEENASVLIADRTPAAAALYFGLGPDRAERLPGHFGALFAAPSDVGERLRAVTALLDHPSSEMLECAQSWLARGNNQSTNPEDLFAFIPRALRMAQARNEGLLVLTARG